MVDGVSKPKRKINVMVFDQADAYVRYDFLAAAGLAEIDAKRGSVAVKIPVSGNGPYALFVHHDENNDKISTKRG